MIEDVVKVFEEFIQQFHKTAVIVLKKEYRRCVVKAYKTLVYSLWFVDRETGDRHNLVSMDTTARVTTEEEEQKLKDECTRKLIYWMFNYIMKFNYVDEQVSDSC